MSYRLRAVAPLLTIALVLSACGGGQPEADREAVVQMLERLGYAPRQAGCMADEFDGEVSVAELQTVIDARGDLTTVDFELNETMVEAKLECEADR